MVFSSGIKYIEAFVASFPYILPIQKKMTAPENPETVTIENRHENYDNLSLVVLGFSDKQMREEVLEQTLSICH